MNFEDLKGKIFLFVSLRLRIARIFLDLEPSKNTLSHIQSYFKVLNHEKKNSEFLFTFSLMQNSFQFDEFFSQKIQNSVFFF